VGLVDNRTRLSNQRVPGIGNVPLTGRAFRRDQGGESHRQVLVFVTPRLLRAEPPAVSDSPVPVRPPAVLTSRAEFEEELRRSLARLRGEGETP
jgi:type II secretory pathway component GspD/PulD (secretin)